MFIGQTNLPTVADMSIAGAFDFFESLELAGQRAQIADKILKEILSLNKLALREIQ